MKKITILFFSILCTTILLHAQTATAPSAGDGSNDNPYQIATLNNLYWIAASSSRWSYHYIQTADIDASETSTWTGSKWIPIGTQGISFTGSYDGQQHTIDGLHINSENTHQGLFGFIDFGATVQRIGVTNADIITRNYGAGAIAGANDGTVTKCYFTGSISAINGWIGGIVGYNAGSISQCYSDGVVNGDYSVGGISGYNQTGEEITNCYNLGAVNGTATDVGGIIGTNDGIITYCYNVGSVSAPEWGGIVGYDGSSGYTSNFYDSKLTGTTYDPPGVTAKTTAEMQTRSTFTNAGWDFTGETTNGTNDYWDIASDKNSGFPYLSWQYTTTAPTVTTQAVSVIGSTSATGNGNISSTGGVNVTERGVYWSTTDGFANGTGTKVSTTGNWSVTGDFTQLITGLTPNTTYYVKAFATNSAGTSYGSQVSFTTSPTLPAPGNALSFDGTNDYVNLGDKIEGLATLTIETWVYYASGGSSTYDEIFSKENVNSLNIWRGGGDKVWFHLGTGTAWFDGGRIVSNSSVPKDRWTHIAVTWDQATTTVKIYINGTLDKTALHTHSGGSVMGSNSALRGIGGYPVTPSHPFKGKLDELRVWNVVRSQAEIQSDMITPISLASGLLCSYNFDVGKASDDNTTGSTMLSDLTGNGNNGTLTNFALSGTSSNWVESYAMVIPTVEAETDLGSVNFTANWTAPAVGTVSNYLLEVATDAAFTNLLSGYNPKTVASPVVSSSVTGLTPNTTYYYRVRADKTSVTGEGAWSKIETVTTNPASEINVQGNSTDIADGSTSPSASNSTDFGSVMIGETISKTFTIQNTGTASLTLSGTPIVSVSGSSAFTVKVQPSSTSVAASSSTTFVVQYAPATTGTVSAEISIANDDSDENPYTFAIQGTGVVQPSNNNALDFDGSNDYVTVPGIASTNFTEITIEFWVYHTKSAIDQKIIGNADNASPRRGVCVGISDTDKLYPEVFNSGSNNVLSSETIPTNKWVHIAVTWKKGNYSDGIKGYVNGKQVISTSTVNTDMNTSNSWTIGAAPWFPEKYFGGKIDEIRIWNKVRTVTEIREDMMRSVNANASGLIAYYRFNETSGTTLRDATLNSYNGTLTNMDGTTDWISSGAFTTWMGMTDNNWGTSSNWSNGVPVAASNVGIYNWDGYAEATVSGTPTVENMMISSTSSPTLGSDITVNGNLILEKNMDLNGKTVTLGSNGTLYEDMGVFSGATGNITTTRNLSNISSQNIGGLGASITTSANMGSTTITRAHGNQSWGGNNSVLRFYDITPTTNSGLNATLTFNYLTSELNGLNESNLKLFKSSDGGTSYVFAGGTVSTDNNNLTITSLNSFSRWMVTESVPVTVTTQAVSNIGSTTAIGNGNITALGIPSPTAYGVCWNTTGTPTISGSKTDEGAASTAGAFTSAITDLSPFTTYYVRAYATNTAGTSYGDEVYFTTSIVTNINNPSLNTLSIYPNPAVNGFTVNTGEKTSMVSIYDTSGCLVLTQQANKETYIDISSLQRGVYLVKANEWVGKLVKK